MTDDPCVTHLAYHPTKLYLSVKTGFFPCIDGGATHAKPADSQQHCWQRTRQRNGTGTRGRPCQTAGYGPSAATTAAADDARWPRRSHGRTPIWWWYGPWGPGSCQGSRRRWWPGWAHVTRWKSNGGNAIGRPAAVRQQRHDHESIGRQEDALEAAGDDATAASAADRPGCQVRLICCNVSLICFAFSAQLPT